MTSDQDASRMTDIPQRSEHRPAQFGLFDEANESRRSGYPRDTVPASRREADENDVCASAIWQRAPARAFELWKRSQRVRGKAEFDEHSIEQYACMWKRWTDFMARRDLDVTLVQAGDVDDFLAGLRGGRLHDRPAAPSTRRRYLFLVARTFAFLESVGVVEANPCAGMPETQRHQANERPARALLTELQEKAFIEWSLEQGEGPRWERARDCALRLLFLASGITVAEARALRVESVHIEPGDTPGSWVGSIDIEAHGQVPARRAPVAPFAVAPLANWLRKRSVLLRAPGELVFNTRRLHDPHDEHAMPAADALSAKEIYDLVASALRACGYERSRAGPQTLRNAFLARQIRAGVELERIRDWAGLQTVEQLRSLARQVPRRDDGVAPA